jgi:uncharacterized protein YndB with AHSA1/START domain
MHAGYAGETRMHNTEKITDKPSKTTNDARVPNAATAERTVILERLLAGSPRQVFKAWTDPEQLVRWFGPEGFVTSDVTAEMHVGGRWGNTMTSPEGKRYVSSGEIRELVPSERLVIFDEGKGEPMLGHATKITVSFEPFGSGTTMRLVHGVFKSVEMRDECVRGWASTFNRLERLMRGEVE